ncbi:MAG: phosphate/phosphite/phosphonate ABC transporter substrate-binding protein [Gammaproteobacteria bacterium]|nr:phosphate/phosphite/phosphonate ABC transporter substrate-binding protein [Gammaproteobacteria bacterium]MDH5800243.1 phosphate/phosphite/phosphonate ABC transporter substrate-binding protein [Gammaproteobacteria bacterium]
MSLHRFTQLIITLVCVPLGNAIAGETLTLGVHPYKSASKIIKAYSPLADYLHQKLNMQVSITIAPDYLTHIQKIGRDEIDIAYLGPASYVEMVEKFGQKPILARQAINGKPTFQGKIIIRNNSPYRSLSELKGTRFAFGDPSSTMSHLVPRYMLIQSGVDTDQLASHSFLGSHDNVALAVLTGDYDAGAVKEAVFYKYKNKGLKVLASTPAFSEHLFVTRKNMPPELVQRLRGLLYVLHESQQGRTILSRIKADITSMQPAADADYDNLRSVISQLKLQGIP